ncbi:hypothetical protein ACVDFE_32125 [Lentzea chajnantorensis]
MSLPSSSSLVSNGNAAHTGCARAAASTARFTVSRSAFATCPTIEAGNASGRCAPSSSLRFSVRLAKTSSSRLAASTTYTQPALETFRPST